MVNEKYARLVFEVEIPDDANNQQIVDTLLASIGNWIKNLDKDPLKVIEDDVIISRYLVHDGAIHINSND